MAEQKRITLKEALELVEFEQDVDGTWHVQGVNGDIHGTVQGSVGAIKGACCIVDGDCDVVEGNCHRVGGKVLTTINGKKWQYIETPRERLERLIKEGATKGQLLEAVNQMEEN